MSFLSNRTFIIVGFFLLALIALPITLIVFRNQQNTKTQADKTVVLSFDPTSSSATQLQIPAGSTFSLDVYVDPGASSVSFVKAEILYDATKFELAGSFIPNQEVFSQIVEGPNNTPGKVTTTLSIGSDTSKALKTKTQVGTVVFKTLNTVPTNATSTISFGNGSQALAISSNSSFDENVIANTIPASIKFNQPSQTCGVSPSDAMLVIDKSGSMNDQAGTSGTKLSNAKTAASNFVDILSAQSSNAIGLATFDNTGYLNSQLTNNYSSVKTQINAINAGSGTCVECGIVKANQEITARKRSGFKNVVVLLTDGRANRIVGSSNEVPVATAEQKALAAATTGHTTNNTVFFTIGLGKDVNSDFLTQLAEDSGGQYYYSPTTDQLNSIYNQISQIIAKGSVTGSVFKDTNSNGIYDQNEDGLSGWILQLASSNGQLQTITSDSTGTYSFPNLCDGSYSLTQISQSGWKQTVPTNPLKYSVSINNGAAVTDRNFGNYKGSRCSDGIDNDGNGYIDAKDSTCHTDGNPGNPNSYDPDKDGENGKNTCSDSKDNNGNGKIDGADPICHEDGDITKPWDPTLPEGTKEVSLSCSPTAVALDDAAKTVSVLLKTADGQPVTGKNVTWSASPSAIAISPLTTTTDSTGKAEASVLVPLHTQAGFNGSIVAKFAGDNNFNTASCVIQANYEGPALDGATLSLDLLLHGIGNSGDNANPTANSLSNKNPLTKTRTTRVSLFDINNNMVSSGAGTITYSSASGSFTGTVKTTSPVPAGKYTIKVGTDFRLTRLVPGIQTIVVGQTNAIPAVHLVAGDANNDNRLDIRDYNTLLDCYSDLSPALACNPEKKTATDGNDDGDVNQFDYNLFLREISTQPGE